MSLDARRGLPAQVTSPPHRPRLWASAQDQKVMSDVLASSCCGKDVYRKLIPYHYTLLDKAAVTSVTGG